MSEGEIEGDSESAADVSTETLTKKILRITAKK